MAYRFVSLTPVGHTDGLDLPVAEQWRRVDVLCAAYGDVAEAAAGNAALQSTIDAGRVRLYEGDLLHVRSLLG